MKNYTLHLICAIAFILTAASDVAAQKFGHLNYGNLLDSLPEVNAARKELDSLKIKLVAAGEDMAKAFEAKYQALQEDYSAGKLSAVDAQKAQAELEKEDQALQKYETDVQKQLELRRIELLRPIVGKVEQAIEAVAKENGFTFIFDSSLPNVMLFAGDQDDVSALVKAKLKM